MRRRVLLPTALFFFSALASLAQDDAYKAMLKRTSVAIHKAQKTMLSKGKTEVGGNLAKAVLLQSHAVKLYEEKKQSRAVCGSAQARELAAAIIKDLNGKADTFYLVSEEEKKLLTECPNEAELLKESKIAFKNLSSTTDKDYADPQSLNTTNIDLK